MAVPDDIRNDVFLSIAKIFQIKYPNIDIMIKTIPSFPALNALCTFMPKPSPTTEIFNKIWVALLFICRYGWPANKAISNPSNKAIGGDIKPDKQQ